MPDPLDTTQPGLFADLPDQVDDGLRSSDAHLLQPCSRCGGSGHEDNPFPRWHPRYLLWDPECRGCRGAGRKLIHMGKFTDA